MTRSPLSISLPGAGTASLTQIPLILQEELFYLFSQSTVYTLMQVVNKHEF